MCCVSTRRGAACKHSNAGELFQVSEQSGEKGWNPGPVRKHTQAAPAGRATNPGRGSSVRDTFQHHGEHQTDTAETRHDSE